jgi:chromosome segregation protein
MTIIKRLEAKGFKSFAKKTELVFEEGFNCILGPNGSGKSNIVDLICFVLGKFSAKGMRAEKSANLIYNGGKSGKSAQQAEATIVFDNSKKEFPMEAGEVSITRLVKSNGSSTYKINNEVRTRQQVVELISAVNLSPDGHNIILQGDIISLIELKGAEKREIIEEISGISSYEDKKNKCLKELEKVDTRLNETEIILTERERNLRELKKERDQAKRYKELEGTIKDFKATLLNLRIKEKQLRTEELGKRKENIQDQINKGKETIVQIKERVSAIQTEIKEINQRIENEGEKSLLFLREEIDDLKTVIVKANSRLEVCFSEIEKIKNRSIQLKEDIKEIDEKVKSLNKEKLENQRKIEELSKNEVSINSKINKIKQDSGLTDASSETLDKIETKVETIEKDLSSIRESHQMLIRTKDQLEFKHKNIQDNLNKIQGTEKSTEVQSLNSLKQQYKDSALELTKNLGAIASISSRIHDARQDTYEKESELNKLKTRQLTIQEAASGDIALRKIIELSKDDGAIHGTVASLGQVDTKYSTALEVAAGGRLSSVVVESDTTAKKCITYLKEKRLGVAKFLPLNKLRERKIQSDVKELIKREDVHGLAIDLVGHDHKYKDVFLYVFGSTIIVNDIEAARKIGIGRIRMITLEGDLIEPSGAMVGGHRHKGKGTGFKETQSEERMVRLENEMADLRSLIDSLDSERTALDSSISELRELKANLNGEIIKLEKTLNIDGKLVDDLLKEKEELDSSIKDNSAELIELEKDIQEKNNQLNELKATRSELKQKLSNTDVIKEIESLEEERLVIREESIKISANIKGIETQINSMLLPEREKILRIIKQHEKELEDFTHESQTLKELVKQRSAELKTKTSDELKYQSKFRSSIEKRQKLNEKIQKHEQDIIRIDEKTIANEERLNDLSIHKAKEVAELEGMHKEFEQYTGNTIKRGFSLDQLKTTIMTGEKELSKIGNVNLRALEVYEEIEREYNGVKEKVVTLKEEKEEILLMMAEIEEKKKEIFIKNFKQISKNFRRIYNSLSHKGEANLILENPESPFEGGLIIQVKLLGGKLFDLKSLSGGEKTMAALAFIFAIQEHSPSPFYLLDEVDAALDKKNSEMLSRLVKKYSDYAQYLVISHNDTIITEADQIYGVSMQDGISKVVSLKV